MENVKACRICLKIDTKFFILQPKSLGLFYELLTGITVPKGVIKYVCFECAALLNKYYRFRQKSLHSQCVLENILHHYGEITETYIAQIDRETLFLNSILSQNDNQLIEEASPSEEKLNLENDDVDFYWRSDDELKMKSEKNLIVKASDENKVEEKHKLSKQQKSQRSKQTKKEPQKPHGINKRRNIKSIPATFCETVTEEELLKEVAVITLKLSIIHLKLKNLIVNITKMDKAKKLEEQYEEVRRRQESSNYSNSFYKCEICFKGFISARAWQNHNKQHNEGEVQCDICKLRFRSKVILSRHVKYHSTKYQCLQCPYVSQGISQAKLHFLWHRGVTYGCDHCGEKFRQRMSHITHLRMKHPSDWVCGVCGNAFVSQMGLLQHKSLRHAQYEKGDVDDNSPAPYCELCDVKFASPEAFKRHVVQARKHVAIAHNKFGCRECGESYKTAKELREHTRARPECLSKRSYSASSGKARGESKAWPISCPHCGKVIENAHAYSWHFRIAHPDKDYYSKCDSICDVCGKGFPKRLLSAHLANHVPGGARKGSKGGTCDICGKVYTASSSLYAHKRTHSDARPYVCTHCGMGFKVKNVMLRHIFVHTGEKPFTCELCGKSFSQSSTRQQHIRTVHHKLPPLYISRSKRERIMKKQATRQCEQC